MPPDQFLNYMLSTVLIYSELPANIWGNETHVRRSYSMYNKLTLLRRSVY